MPSWMNLTENYPQLSNENTTIINDSVWTFTVITNVTHLASLMTISQSHWVTAFKVYELANAGLLPYKVIRHYIYQATN